MIATIDRLYALKQRLDVEFDTFDKKIDARPVFYSQNEVALMRRLVTEYIDEAEEVLHLEYGINH